MLLALLRFAAPESLRGDDLAFELLWSHATPAGSYQGEALEVVDVDTDGVAEILAPGCFGHCWLALARGGGLYRQLSTSVPREPLGFLRVGRPVAGSPLVLASFAGRLEITSWEGERIDTRAFELATDAPLDFGIANLAGDGVDRLVVVDDDDLFVHDPTTGSIVATAPGLGGADLDFGQLDTDPALEIAVATLTGSCHVVDGATLLVEWSLSSCGPRIAVGDLVAGGSEELLTASGSEWTSWLLQAWQLPSSTAVWESGPYFFTRAALTVQDADPTPGEEILWGGEGCDALRLLRGADGSPLRSLPYPDSRAFGTGDTDGDGRAELVLTRDSYVWRASIAFLDLETAAVEHVTPAYYLQSRGLAAGDIDGDGDRELVAGGWISPNGAEPFAYAMSFAGSDGAGPVAGRLSDTPWWNGMISQFRLADLEGDGDLELCATYSVGFSYVGCFSLPDLGPLWATQMSPPPSELLLADLDGDILPELIVERHGSAAESYVAALDPRSGQPLWTSANLAPATSDVDLLCLGEIDAAPGTDLVAGDADTGAFSLLDPADGGLVRAVASAARGGLECGDLDRDGDLELVGSDFATNTLGVLDPESGAWQLAIATTAFRVQAIGDLFGDERPELAGDDLDGLQVLDAVSGRELWATDAQQPIDWFSGSLEVLDVDGDGQRELVSSSIHGIAAFGRRSTASSIFADGFESGDSVYWSRLRI